MAAPIGVSPCAASFGGVKTVADSNGSSVFTGPKVTIPISTLFSAN